MRLAEVSNQANICPYGNDRRGIIFLIWILPLASRAEPVDTVKRGGLVTFSQGGIVEHVVDEIFHPTLESHHSLPNVDKFTRAFTDDVYAL